MKKIIGMCLGIVMIFNCTFIKVDGHENNKYLEEINIANEFIRNVLNKDSYNRIIELYDTNDNIKYLFFDLRQDGYVIIDIENNVVVEGGTEENKFIPQVDEKCYYNGPLLYYEKSNDHFVEVHSQQMVDKRDLAESMEISKKAVNRSKVIRGEESNIMPLANTEYDITITGTLPNYSYNPNGICGSTAAAMFLRYLDIYVNSNYVATSLQTSDGEALIKELVSYIDGWFPGSNANDMKSGLQKYINSRGISHTIVKENYSSSSFKTRINANRPVVVGLENHPTYEDHWVTAYGYYISTTPTVAYVIVNDGWGDRGVYINPSYIDYIVY